MLERQSIERSNAFVSTLSRFHDRQDHRFLLFFFCCTWTRFVFPPPATRSKACSVSCKSKRVHVKCTPKDSYFERAFKWHQEHTFATNLSIYIHKFASIDRHKFGSERRDRLANCQSIRFQSLSFRFGLISSSVELVTSGHEPIMSEHQVELTFLQQPLWMNWSDWSDQIESSRCPSTTDCCVVCFLLQQNARPSKQFYNSQSINSLPILRPISIRNRWQSSSIDSSLSSSATSISSNPTLSSTALAASPLPPPPSSSSSLFSMQSGRKSSRSSELALNRVRLRKSPTIDNYNRIAVWNVRFDSSIELQQTQL
jgi:hypothetical protein